MNHVQPKGHSFLWLVIAASMMLWSGCSLRAPLQSEPIGDFGRIEFRDPNGELDGVVVGASHGLSEPDAVEYATALSDKIGAGLVIAYGFGAKRIPVTQPLIHSQPIVAAADPRRRSVYPAFKAFLHKLANGPVKFYIGVRVANEQSDATRIETATAGLTMEQLTALKESFNHIRDRAIEGTAAPKIDIAMEPLDEISWQATGIKHHGVLMLAARGLVLRLPASLSEESAKQTYNKILSGWIQETLDMTGKNPAGLAEMEVAILRHGKMESIPARQGVGIVIGAPHGTFDPYTAAVVRRICYRTGLAGVVATGFTPTESGSGWRINVNRPSERYFPSGEGEIETERAAAAYQRYKSFVIKAAQGELKLYFDIHQNGGQRIEVATVGISKEDARFVKNAYLSLRDNALAGRSDIAVTDIAVEPLDEIEVGAWAAKTHGILAVVKQGLHFELPADGVMATASQRQVYTHILADLIAKIAAEIPPSQ